MPIPIRETFATDRGDLIVQVTDDGSRTLVKRGTEDAFHSGCGALSETRHVYLDASGVAERLRSGVSSRVLEIGLGSSMALLLSMDCAVKHNAELDYTAMEMDWLSAQTLSFLNPGEWVSESWIVESYLCFRDTLPERPQPGIYHWPLDAKRTASIHLGDALTRLGELDGKFDAVFFDPFCPESAPDFWTAAVFSKLRSITDQDGTLTTYSCSRLVRDALCQGGWDATRIPGPEGGKREILKAQPVADDQ